MIEVLANAEQEPPNKLSESNGSEAVEENKRTPKYGSMNEFRNQVYPGVSDENWNDWHWQIANRVTDVNAMERALGRTGGC